MKTIEKTTAEKLEELLTETSLLIVLRREEDGRFTVELTPDDLPTDPDALCSTFVSLERAIDHAYSQQ
jgi:hypothetical protein